MAPKQPHLASLIGTAFDTTVKALHKRLPDLGYPDIRPVHCTNVFRLIDPDGTRPGVLAERARVSPQAMAEFLDYLEKRNYIVRQPDPTDRRARIALLTPRGIEACKAVQRTFQEIEESWSNLIPDPDLKALRRSLETIIAIES